MCVRGTMAQRQTREIHCTHNRWKSVHKWQFFLNVDARRELRRMTCRLHACLLLPRFIVKTSYVGNDRYACVHSLTSQHVWTKATPKWLAAIHFCIQVHTSNSFLPSCMRMSVSGTQFFQSTAPARPFIRIFSAYKTCAVLLSWRRERKITRYVVRRIMSRQHKTVACTVHVGMPEEVNDQLYIQPGVQGLKTMSCEKSDE